MLCTHCQINESTCNVFCFVRGRDSDGVQNTATIAELCNACVEKLVTGIFVPEYPNDRVSISDAMSH